MNNSSLGWKIFGLFVSIGLIIGGLSGELVLRGTESSSALVVVGFLFLIWDIYAIATHKKKQVEGVEENEEEALPASVPATEQGGARVTVPRFEGNEQQSYIILEHKVGSRYHNAGELQKIDADRVEIGRDLRCDVRFDENFETVSRRHAVIIRDGNHWKLAPLSQTNSTFINGETVHREWFLQHGDEIQCAVNGPKLVFRIGTEDNL
jgi:hypothetical protein